MKTVLFWFLLQEFLKANGEGNAIKLTEVETGTSDFETIFKAAKDKKVNQYLTDGKKFKSLKAISRCSYSF